MALVKISDYYVNEEATVCDALDALSGATEIKLTDDADMYFDGSPCALGVMLSETPAVAITDFDNYIGIEDGCLRPLPDPGPLLYDHTTIKPLFLYREEQVNVNGGASYGSPERDPIEVGEITIPVFAQDMVILYYATILWNRGGAAYQMKYLPKYGEQLMEPGYTELWEESITLTWATSSAYSNHISHSAGTEAKIRLLVKHMTGTVRVLASAIVFKAS